MHISPDFSAHLHSYVIFIVHIIQCLVKILYSVNKIKESGVDLRILLHSSVNYYAGLLETEYTG
ncbi:hypothetical protein O3G_MSEX003218 [Manduca sexta]|uniref:Uncharacterized protein n=1 Tax=Manduca sexta TaxID=7130 RepID=A0A921YQX5_MANSE|nr:hypothetical protein O3G_MSEX003218 [Manduca sexta]